MAKINKTSNFSSALRTFSSRTISFFCEHVAMKNTMVTSAIWERCLEWSKGTRTFTHQGFGTVRADVSTVKRTS